MILLRSQITMRSFTSNRIFVRAVIVGFFMGALSVHVQANQDPELVAKTNGNSLDNKAIAAIDSPHVISSDRSVWQAIQQNFQLKPVPHASALSAMKKHQNWFTDHPAYTQRMLRRAEKYLSYVVNEVAKRKMPSEIALLPMIESAYNPMATSSKGAVGIWQFISSTGHDFGLMQNAWLDQRRGVVQSTQAALDYLEKLYAEFGSWELALAAYNAGEGRIAKTVKANKRLGKPHGYYDLSLPRETREFVPKLLAIKAVLGQTERYRQALLSLPMTHYFREVTLPRPVDVNLIPVLAGITLNEFKLLNAEHKMPLLSPDDYAPRVLVPVSSADKFGLALANATQPLATWIAYHPVAGETAQGIAEKFGLDLTALMQLNRLTVYTRLTSSRALLVPKNPGQLAYLMAQQKNPQPSGVITHHISFGDSLRSIARKYKVSPQALIAFNELRSKKLIIGTTLDIPSE